VVLARHSADPQFPFKALFQREILNLTAPDADGWATGDCPYCRQPAGFRANLVTGRWVCLPPPTSRPDPDRERQRGRRFSAGGRAPMPGEAASARRGARKVVSLTDERPVELSARPRCGTRGDV
jgi:hypothetical protein